MHSLKINYFLDTERENSAGEAPIRIRSRFNSDKLIVRSTGYVCKKEYWNAAKQKTKNDPTVNTYLEGLEYSLMETYRELSKTRQGITLADCWETINPKEEAVEGELKAPKSSKISDWLDYYVQTSPNSKGYTRGVNTLRANLIGEYKFKGTNVRKVKVFDKNLRFEDLNQSKIDAWVTFLAGQGKSTGTITKIMKFLKQVGKLARDKKVEVGSLDFKLPRTFKKKSKTTIRLSYSELKQVMNYTPKSESLSLTKDLFLFLAFSGIRFGDAVRLTPARIQKDFIQVYQEKVDELALVTINKFTAPILDKYKKGKKSTDRLFPYQPGQLFNRNIKAICKAAGLTEDIEMTRYEGAAAVQSIVPKYTQVSSHTGRRTCAKLLSMLGIPETDIADELGHRTQSITETYIGTPNHRKRIKKVQTAWAKIEKL